MEAIVMADSGAAVSVIGASLARTLEQAGFRSYSCDIPLMLATGPKPTRCSSFILIADARIETRYGYRPLPPIPLIVASDLNLDGILGLDALGSAGLLVDATISSIWHISDIQKRAAELEASCPLLAITPAITLPDLLKASPAPEPEPAPTFELRDDARDAASDPRITQLVTKHNRIFGKLTELPPPRGIYDGEMLIRDPNRPPARQRNRIRTEADIKDADRLLAKWVPTGFAERRDTPWASPMAFAGRPKKDATRRPIFDKRTTNSRTDGFTYPLPLIPDMIRSTHGARLRSVLDCSSAYNQLRIRTDHEIFNGFICHSGTYVAKMCMLGAKNSGLYWQRFIDAVLVGDPDALPRWPTGHPRHDEGEREYAKHQANPDLLSDLSPFTQAYSDDIQIFSRCEDDHIAHLAQVFARLDLYAIRVNEFHRFGATSVDFLGFRVGADQVAMLPDKRSPIETWPTPTNVKELQQFLGVLQFYRAHVPNASRWTSMLTPLTRKADKNVARTRFAFTEAEMHAFNRLRELIAEDIHLTIPDPTQPFIMVTDASKYALAGCLLQPANDGRLHVISYYSRQTTDAESRAGQFKLEVFALSACARHWRPTFAGHPIVAYTDCEPVVSGRLLAMSRDITDDPSGKLLRQVLSVQDLAIDLRHHAASTELADHVDQFSRRPDYVASKPKNFRAYIRDIQQLHLDDPTRNTPAPTLVMHVVRGDAFDSILEPEEHDPVPFDICLVVPALIVATTTPFSSPPPSTPNPDLATMPDDLILDRIRTGMLAAPESARTGLDFSHGHWRRNGRIAVPPDIPLQHELVRRAHEPGHRGITATGRTLASRFWWPEMHVQVRERIATCDVCLSMKPKPARMYAGSTPRPPPSTAFATLAIDFIPALPTNTLMGGEVSRILTVVDEFSTYGIFIAVPDTLTSEGFTEIFLNRVYTRTGMPQTIRSDNDALLRRVWHAFRRQARITESRESPPYRHEANGHAERANSTIEGILRTLIDPAEPDLWARHLAIAEKIYNATPHNITGLTPDVMAFHREFRLGFGIGDAPTDLNTGDLERAAADIDKRVRDFQIRAEVSRARRDTRGLPTHRVGDLVLISTEMLRIPTLSKDHRLRPRWIGPFRISQRLGLRQYKLALPPTSKIINKFDVNRLRPYTGTSTSIPTPDITDIENEEAELHYIIEKIISLHGHVDDDGRVTKTHALVKWKDYDESWNEMVTLDTLVDDAPGSLDDHLNSIAGSPRLPASVQQRLDHFRLTASRDNSRDTSTS